MRGAGRVAAGPVFDEHALDALAGTLGSSGASGENDRFGLVTKGTSAAHVQGASVIRWLPSLGISIDHLVIDWYLTSRQERKRQMRERRIKFE